MYARASKPLVRASSITKSHLQPQAMASQEKMTIAKFTSQHRQNFPVNFTVCKGFYGPSEDLKFSEGDKFRAHSLNQSTVVNVEYDTGIRKNVPANSSVPFAVLFDPYNNTKEAMKGYRFEKVSELIQLPVLPPVLWCRKAYHGSSQDSSVTANELLIVKRVKTRVVGRQQLKVYSYTQKKDKTLYTTCVGSFSTKPRDISLYLSDLLKHMPDIFPCRAVMNPGAEPTQGGQGPCIVTLMHSSMDSSLVISSALREVSQAKMLEIPIDLGILVKLDEEESSSHNHGESVYEDASKFTSSIQEPHPPATTDDGSRSQFYTNVHFGQECSRQPTFSSVEAAVEQGHYQTPSGLVRTERAPSDPIPIDNVSVSSHPPDNYVLLGKGGEGQASFEKSPVDSNSSPPFWRPPLPPPNKVKWEVSLLLVRI